MEEIGERRVLILSRELLATVSAAAGQHLAAAGGGHAGAKAVAALAHDLARLIGALHGTCSWEAAAAADRKGAGFLVSRPGPVNGRQGGSRFEILGPSKRYTPP